MTQAILYYYEDGLHHSNARSLEEAAENAEGIFDDAIYFLTEIAQVVPESFVPILAVGDQVKFMGGFSATGEVLALFLDDGVQFAVIRNTHDGYISFHPVGRLTVVEAP